MKTLSPVVTGERVPRAKKLTRDFCDEDVESVVIGESVLNMAEASYGIKELRKFFKNKSNN